MDPLILVGLHLNVDVLDQGPQADCLVLGHPKDFFRVVEAVVRLTLHELNDFFLLSLAIVIYLLRIRPIRYIQILKAWGLVVIFKSGLQLLLELVPREFVTV